MIRILRHVVDLEPAEEDFQVDHVTINDLDPELLDNIEDIPLTASDITDVVERFIEKHNECQHRCAEIFSKDEIIAFVESSRILDYTENRCNRLNLAILAQLRVIYRRRITKESRRHGTIASRGSKKPKCNFLIEGETVCKEFYLFVHNIGEKRWRSLLQIYGSEGLIEKKHNRCLREPHNATPSDRKEEVVQFLKNYATQHATLITRGQANQKNIVQVLPSGLSKKILYEQYKETVDGEVTSLYVFMKIWRMYCPEIVLTNSQKKINR